MEVFMVLDLDDYFYDARFAKEKPDPKGSLQERCGDNFYSRNNDGGWVQHRNRFHLSDELKQQDTRYAKVYVALRFWYRGRSANATPPQFLSLAGGRGVRVNHDPLVVRDFLNWVQNEFDPGIANRPIDNPDFQDAKFGER
jgi:hypothetical protein